MPFGLKLIRFIAVFHIIASIASLAAVKFFSATLPIFPKILSPSLYINWILGVLPSVIAIAAIQKRTSVLYWATLASAILAQIPFVQPLLRETGGFLTVGSYILYVTPYAFFFWYWIQAKSYLTSPSASGISPQLTKAEAAIKWFVAAWIILYVAFRIVAMWIGAQDAINLVKYIRLLEGKSYKERVQYCLQSAPKSGKDTCLFSAFSMTKNKENITVEDCNKVNDERYRFPCYAMGGHCEQITDETRRTSCEETSKIYERKN